MKLADLMEANADELAALETLDNGKAFSASLCSSSRLVRSAR
jgi:acyl-CoA reductase-like NAD-dependent aldehyde dehydrogenase